MPCYKIEKNNIPRFKNFNNLTDAQIYADSLGTGFLVTLASNQNLPPYTRTRKDDQLFCSDLYNSFIDGNRVANITMQESQELIAALGGLKQLVDAGAVAEIKMLLQSLTNSLPIARVYTLERRDLDILKIDSWTDSL